MAREMLPYVLLSMHYAVTEFFYYDYRNASEDNVNGLLSVSW